MEIPLPGNPLKSVNSYVVKGDARHLIIDAGLHMEACREAFLGGLKTLSIALEDCDIFITHMHADHFALLLDIQLPPETKIFLGEKDVEFLESWSGWEQIYPASRANGFPVEELSAQSQTNPFLKFDLENMPRLTPLRGDEVIEVGDFSLQCVTTPGHTEGHTCLLEPSKKLLFSGDHILGEITPNIQGWAEHRNPLDQYLQSLELEALKTGIALVLPGHRKPFSECASRIDQLKSHHAKRAEEALAALGQAAKTAYEVAPEMNWDFSVEQWEEWPLAQRWFATGEALAHLKYLLKEGKVVEEREGGKIRYRAV